MASRRTFPVPNKNLSGSDYIANKRAKQLFSGTSNLAKTIEQQNGNFPLLTPLGKLKPYQGTFGLSGRSSTSPSDKTYCLNTSHSYCDLLSITRGKYLLTPPNVSDQPVIRLQDVNDPTKLYNGIYYVYIYSNTTNALYYMNPAYPSTTPATYITNQIEYDVTGNANERIIVDPSFILHYQSQSCILRHKISPNIEINNDYDAKYSFNRTINLDLFSGFQYPIKFSLDYDIGDCIDTSNDLQSKYALPSVPYNITPPVISGTPTYLVGSILTTTDGYWGGSAIIVYYYQWLRNGAVIPGAFNSSYTIVASDVQESITCEVVGTNSSGFSSALSNSLIPSDPPVNSVAPSITGIAPYAVGTTLTLTSDGTWGGVPPPTYTYQWHKGSSPISGATSTSYLIAANDAGQPITCQVTATNSSGTSLPASSNTITPTGVPVTNTPPIVTGSTSVGSTLNTTPGTWYSSPALNPLPYQYQWYKGSSPISGATSTSYLIAANDAGQPITCEVTATNSSGTSLPAPSNTITPTGVPVTNTPPIVTGSTSVGSTLNTTPGTWYSSPALNPLPYQHQWYKGSSPISGATNSSYTILLGDVGHLIKCEVTATNSSGTSLPASSNTITPTLDPPVNSVAPLITGPPGTPPYHVSDLLTTSNGTWSGTPTPTFTYQWKKNGVSIPTETNTTYTIVLGDVGQSIKCDVTGTNASGSSTASSNTIIPV